MSSAPSRCPPWLLSLISLLASVASSPPPVISSPTPLISPSFLCPSLSLHLPRGHIPDKFEQGNDGLWRKDDLYTLYGSTICPSCDDPTSVMVDNAASNPSPSGPPTSNDSVFDINSLPPGWKPAGAVAKRTSLIIILSVVLTFLICVSLIVSLMWKRARSKRPLTNVDLEKKLKTRRRRVPLEDSTETEDKTIKKLWTRATARWKANARYTTRQRRGKRGIIRSQSNSSAISLTRRDSHVPSAPSALPPAYHYDTSDARAAANDYPSSSPHLPHTAHVAIDDKAILAQMVDLVSAPLADSDAPICGGSVPTWPDSGEEEAFVSGADTPAADESSEPRSVFPSPPSKLPDSYFDLFEATASEPSAPPFAEADLFPSAPPLAHDSSEMEASVPDWDDNLLHDVEEGQSLPTPHSSDSLTQSSTPRVNRAHMLPSYQP